MWFGILSVAAIVCLALSVGMSFAHVLEMPVKLGYSPELYAAVNSSLYYGFGTVGAGIVVASVLLTTAWAVMAWRQRDIRRGWSVAAAVLVWAGLATWWAIVQPVNAEASRVWTQIDPGQPTTQTWQMPPEVVALWQQRHRQWEYGHTVVFLLNFGAFLTLALAHRR